MTDYSKGGIIRVGDVRSAGHRLAAVVAQFLDTNSTCGDVKELREALEAYNRALDEAARMTI